MYNQHNPYEKTTEIRKELALMQKEKDKLELKLAAADPEQKLSFIPNVFLHPGKASLTHRRIDLQLHFEQFRMCLYRDNIKREQF